MEKRENTDFLDLELLPANGGRIKGEKGDRLREREREREFAGAF